MQTNRVMIAGNLGRDAETRFTKDGRAFTTFSIANNRNYNDATGTKQQTTLWVNCVMWRKGNENLAPHLKKGRAVVIDGRLSSRKYEKEGVEVTAWEVVVEEVDFAGGGDRAENGNGASAPKSNEADDDFFDGGDEPPF